MEDESDGEAVVETDATAAEPGDIAWWPGIVWLTGAVLLGGRACLARALLAAFRRRSAALADDLLTRRVRSVAQRLGYRRSVRIVQANRLRTPAAFGLLRPTLALPNGFGTEFTQPQQEAMLAHELAHLAVHDPAWHFLADLVVAAFWWHPLAWWARAQLRAASEAAADEASLVLTDGPGVLAACLVQLGGRLLEKRSAGWLSMAGNGFRSGLGRRVERLLRLGAGTWRPPGVFRSAMILFLGPALLVSASALSTAWARAPAPVEGDESMIHAWKHSLAATVFVVTFGPANPAFGEDPIGQAGTPAAETRGGAGGGPAAGTRRKAEAVTKDQLKKIAGELKTVLDLTAAADQGLNQAKDQDAEAIRQQLRELAARADQLEAEKARLEADLKKLASERGKVEANAKQALRIKVFRLKHRDPDELSGVLTELLPPRQTGMPGKGGGTFMQGMGGPGGGAGGMMGMMQGSGAPGGGLMGGPSAGALGMGGLGGMGGAMGLGGGMGGQFRPETSWRIAVDARTNSLIVRGTDDDLRTIADMITALDLPDGQATTKLKNFRTFRLKHADAGQVAAIVQELDIKATVSVIGSANMVAVSGSEAALKEVGDLIEALDVEGKAGKVTAPKQ
jgi:uncharacterized protein (UPF0335 family)